MKKTVHITTVHQRLDSRIFYKECLSLKRNGYDVTLIVADGLGDQTIEGVKILDVGKSSGNRIMRVLNSTRKAVKKALSLHADIYHYHDPELMRATAKLAKHARVIFDSHEDFPALMKQREYIPKALRGLLFKTAVRMEKRTALKLSAVICATETIEQKFKSYGIVKTVTIKNYPIIKPVENPVQHHTIKPPKACYVGGLTPIRGVEQMIKACQKAGMGLILAGPFDSREYFNRMQSLSGWKNVEYLGYVPNKEIAEKVYDKASLGLVLLQKAPNHTYSIPIKQMEYMANGLPVVASNEVIFCRMVTEEEKCGIVVDPLNVKEIADAMKEIANNPDKAKKMSENALKASSDKYNWNSQEKKLTELYRQLLS